MLTLELATFHSFAPSGCPERVEGREMKGIARPSATNDLAARGYALSAVIFARRRQLFSNLRQQQVGRGA
jgi:hypothetical protein